MNGVTEKIGKTNSELMVTIRCITYNHEPYIRQCLEGFVMQKTNFRFEAIVHDDASTDGTTGIIQEYAEKYPDIIKPIYETENQYSKHDGSLNRIMNEHTHGKYAAMCEGDDYWIDPCKLQMQVDYLESNLDIGMCYTDFDIYYQSKGKYEKSLFASKPQQYPKDYLSVEEWILRNGYVAPPTWLFRRELLPCSLDESIDGTFVLFAHFLVMTRVKCIDEVTATYRFLGESAAHSKSYEKIYYRQRKLLETKLNLIEKYDLSSGLIEKCIQKYLKQGLAQFVIHNRKGEIFLAKQYLKERKYREKILFYIDDLHLNIVLKFVYDLFIKRVR